MAGVVALLGALECLIPFLGGEDVGCSKSDGGGGAACDICTGEAIGSADRGGENGDCIVTAGGDWGDEKTPIEVGLVLRPSALGDRLARELVGVT